MLQYSKDILTTATAKVGSAAVVTSAEGKATTKIAMSNEGHLELAATKGVGREHKVSNRER